MNDQIAEAVAAALEKERREVTARSEEEHREAAKAIAAEFKDEQGRQAEAVALQLEKERREAAKEEAAELERRHRRQADITAGQFERDRQDDASRVALELERGSRDSASTLARWQGTTDAHVRENSRRLDGINGSLESVERDMTALKVMFATLRTRVAVMAGIAALGGSGLVAIVANTFGGSP